MNVIIGSVSSYQQGIVTIFHFFNVPIRSYFLPQRFGALSVLFD